MASPTTGSRVAERGRSEPQHQTRRGRQSPTTGAPMEPTTRGSGRPRFAEDGVGGCRGQSSWRVGAGSTPTCTPSSAETWQAVQTHSVGATGVQLPLQPGAG